MKHTAFWMSLLTLTFGAALMMTACGDLEDDTDCDPESEFYDEEACEDEFVDDNNGANDPINQDINVNNSGFAPLSVTVPAGSTITWTSTTNDQTTITMQNAPSGASTDVKEFDMLLNGMQSTTLILRTTGTYTYQSRLGARAGQITGTIRVE